MLAVWKYPMLLPLVDDFQMAMQVGAKVLTVQMQDGTPCIWALVDPDQPTDLFDFRLAGTGHRIHGGLDGGFDAFDYVGTFQLPEEGLVFHLFLRQFVR